MRRWITALCTLVLVLSMGAVAHAAELSLSSPRPPSLAMTEKCAQAEIDISGTEGEGTLTVAGIPAECSGLPIDVWLHDAGATSRITAEAPAGGGEVTLTPSAPLTTRAAALATIDTWPLPTTANIAARPFVTCRTPEDPAAGCEVEVVFEDDWYSGGGPLTHWHRIVEISSDSLDQVPWELTFNLSADSILVQPTNLFYDDEGGLQVVSSARCDVEPRTVTVQGRTDWGRHHLVGGELPPLRIGVQGAATASGYPSGADLLRCP